MAFVAYRNTFGKDGKVVFSSKDNYHYQIMQALKERGYTDVEGDILKEGSWLGEDGGYIVHASLKEGGKAVFFMAQDAETADLVTEAVKLSIPGIVLHDKIKVDPPQ
jgi:hypothetical protein